MMNSQMTKCHDYLAVKIFELYEIKPTESEFFVLD